MKNLFLSSSIILTLFYTVPVFAAHPCELSLATSVATVDVAAELYDSIKSKKVGLHFPASVSGKSLIPLKILQELDEHLSTKTKLKLLEISSIGLEFLHGERFGILVHYKDTKYKSPKVLASSGNDILLWYSYLRASIKDPQKFVPLDINHLPKRPQIKVNNSWSRVKNNRFNTIRDLADYKESFGSKFLPFLNKLKGENVWIDMGAGSAYAMSEFLKESINKNKELPKCIAVAYRYPWGPEKLAELYEDLGNTPQFNYIEGKQTLATLATFPKADVITDLMGIYTYHSNPEMVFKQYLKILNPGGVIYIDSYRFDAILPIIENSPNLKMEILGFGGSIMVTKVAEKQ